MRRRLLEQVADLLQLLAQRGRRRRQGNGNRGGALRRSCGGARLNGVAVEAVARTVDREPLLVEQVADATDQQHLVVLVIAPVAAPLDRLELRELLFPVAQHVRLDRTEVTDLADREVALRGDRREVGLSSA